MRVLLNINRFCARCNDKLNEFEILTCSECTLVVGKCPEDSRIICFVCGDDWAHPVTTICNSCVAYVEVGNVLPA